VATVEARRHPLAHRSHFVRPIAPVGQDMLHGQLSGAERRIFAKAHRVVLVSLLRNVVVAAKVPMQESH
jgi:hypothetical protein